METLTVYQMPGGRAVPPSPALARVSSNRIHVLMRDVRRNRVQRQTDPSGAISLLAG
jgi:hypothetical protein